MLHTGFQISVAFVHVVGFNLMTERVPTVELISILNRLFAAFDSVTDNQEFHRVEVP